MGGVLGAQGHARGVGVCQKCVRPCLQETLAVCSLTYHHGFHWSGTAAAALHTPLQVCTGTLHAKLTANSALAPRPLLFGSAKHRAATACRQIPATAGADVVATAAAIAASAQALSAAY